MSTEGECVDGQEPTPARNFSLIDEKSRLLLSSPDQSTRILLLSRLIESLSRSGPSDEQDPLKTAIPPDIVDKLRSLPLAEALDLASVDCGITIAVDGEAMRQRLAILELVQRDRAIFEHFIRRGASPQLMARLFSASQAAIRGARRLIAPETANGGRPRQPPEPLRSQIDDAWRELSALQISERERYYKLSSLFPEQPIVSLEAVIDGSAAARSRAA